MKKLSIVVPAYTEEAVLELFYEETKKVLEEIKDNYDYELLFVDDGSRDNTLKVLRQMCKIDKKINVISFSRNFGK